MKSLEKHHNRGFTLVEMIVVLVILALLAALLIPAMTGWIKKAKYQACRVSALEVSRYYLALAAYCEYEVGDSEPLLSEAATEFGGSVSTANSYHAECGGDITVTYSADRTRIIGAVCSVHGELFDYSDGGYTDSQLADGIYAAVSAAAASLSAKTYYSGVPSEGYSTLLDAVPGAMLSSLAGKTWLVNRTSAGYASFDVYVYDGDVSALPGNTYSVHVTVYSYDAAGLTATSEKDVYLGTKTVNGTTYRVLSA